MTEGSRFEWQCRVMEVFKDPSAVGKIPKISGDVQERARLPRWLQTLCLQGRETEEHNEIKIQAQKLIFGPN